jgi:hypothetical protein
MSIFDNITAATDLEDAVVATLQKWFATYLKEYEIQAGLIPDHTYASKHPLPKQYIRVTEMDKEAADQMPTLAVVNAGLSGRQSPMQEGDGTFRVTWGVGIGVFVAANNRPSTMALVRTYSAIVRTIMLQKQSLGGFADGTKWLDESYDDAFRFTDEQTISAGQVVFEVEVAGVVNRFGGPKTPDPLPDQPGSSWPIATQVIATVEVKED